MSRTQAYKVIFEPAEEGGYTVYVPSLPGCISEGDTYEEALANIKEAIKGWIEVCKQFGDEIPHSDVDFPRFSGHQPKSLLLDFYMFLKFLSGL